MDFDVAISGAGPAGAMLALLLAKSGVRVALLERERLLDREFRGPAYQPAAARLWDEAGILDTILELDHRKFSGFSFQYEGKELVHLDYSDLPPPYNQVFVLKQAELLRRLIELAGEYPNFIYLGGMPVDSLTERGVRVGSEEIGARLVVAADGRFSTLRKGAGIEMTSYKQGFDLVWFEMPQPEGVSPDLTFRLTRKGLLLTLPKEHGLVQVGWLLRKGDYPAFKSRGIDLFRDELIKTDPSFAKPLEEQLKSWDECALLDVKMGVAKRWSQDGLLLIGDAAHIASPVGALGNKLALEDAAAAHPIIVEALQKGSGRLPNDLLKPFEELRRPAITRTLRLQREVGRMVLEMKNPLLVGLRQWIVPLIAPLVQKGIREEIALSTQPVSVATSLFEERPSRLYHRLKVLEVKDETADAKSYTLERPPSISYKAGQFVTLRVLREGRLLKRCYSLSSSPLEEDHLRITVKRVKDGLVSGLIHDNVHVGDHLLVLPPSGLFVIPDTQPHHYLFVAGGSGITPVRSLITTIKQRSPQSRLSLLYVNQNRESTIFHDELDSLLDVEYWYTAEHGHPQLGDLQAFYSCAAEDSSPLLYICGPQGLMEAAREASLLPTDQIFQETFLSAVGLQEEQVSQAGPLAAGEGEPGLPHFIGIELDGKTSQVPYREGATILDATLQAGLPAPFSCQEGICATCRAHLLEGSVTMEKHGALSEEEAKQGIILACQAKPTSSSCKISFPSHSTS